MRIKLGRITNTIEENEEKWKNRGITYLPLSLSLSLSFLPWFYELWPFILAADAAKAAQGHAVELQFGMDP